MYNPIFVKHNIVQ